MSFGGHDTLGNQPLPVGGRRFDTPALRTVHGSFFGGGIRNRVLRAKRVAAVVEEEASQMRRLLQTDLLHAESGTTLIFVGLRKGIGVDRNHAGKHVTPGFVEISRAPQFSGKPHDDGGESCADPEGNEDFKKQAAHRLAFSGLLLPNFVF